MTDLPTWNNLSDVDKGAVLLHLHKREWEGADYAEEHYPAAFFDHPTLTSMDPEEACAFAVSVKNVADALDHSDHGYLYDLALAEPARRCLWGARRLSHAGDPYVFTTDYADSPRKAAHELLKSWAKTGTDDARAVMHRAEPGGEWHAEGECDGCRTAVTS